MKTVNSKISDISIRDSNKLDPWKHYTRPAFLLCVFLLAAAGVVMSVIIEKLELYLTNEPLPINKSLDLLAGEADTTLGPYKILQKSKIENEEIIEALGTEEYVQWVLEDPEQPEGSAVRYCSLFITYYDKPDRVPHVPEECYAGAGNQRLDSDNMYIEITGTEKQQIPVRYLVFSSTSNTVLGPSNEFSVMYTINVNGQYAGNREKARFLLNQNIFSKYSYFSKVEWKFFNMGFGGHYYPEKKDFVKASEKLLGTVLPILEKEHWPIDVVNEQ